MFLLFVLIITTLIIVYRPWTMTGVGPIGLIFALGTGTWSLAVFFGGISAIALLSLYFIDPDILPPAEKYRREVANIVRTILAMSLVAVSEFISHHSWLENPISRGIRAWQKFNLPERLRRRFRRRFRAELWKERHPSRWTRAWNHFWQTSGW